MASTGTPSPAVARRRVSLALRRAREAKNWTQTQVANAMEWSLSKVMRIEKGQVNISPTDLRAVLQILDVTDTAEVDELLADARVSRAERYTPDEFDREHLTSAMIELFQYEIAATSIRHFNNTVIPGPLQTRSYAEAMLASDILGLDEATVQARLEARLQRSRRLLASGSGPEYRIIIDEAVLRRVAAAPEVMAEQLDRLASLANHERLRIRVAPFRVNVPIVHLGPFMVVDLADDSPILYRESPVGDELVKGTSVVERHTMIFDRLWPAILDENASQALIQAMAKDHLADRG